MNNKAVLFISLLISANTVWAESSLFGSLAKQVATDAATAAAPEAVKNAVAANQALEQAKALKGAMSNAPDTLKQQAQERLKAAAEQKIRESASAVAPNAVKNIEAAKQTLDQANALKGALTTAPDALKQQAQNQAQETVKAKVQEETAKGMMQLLR
jgi:hypothetical protein